jgi:hypothetical protein
MNVQKTLLLHYFFLIFSNNKFPSFGTKNYEVKFLMHKKNLEFTIKKSKFEVLVPTYLFISKWQ